MNDITDSVLVRAAVLGGTAPSVNNSQPWRWRVGDGVLDLMLEPRRLLGAADPDGRLAILSCGAALHHARLELAASGWEVQVDRSCGGDRLARIRLGARGTPDDDVARLVRASLRRCTDRRTVPMVALDDRKLMSVGAAVRAEGADLTLLSLDQVAVLAAALERAQEVEEADPAWQVELDHWVGGHRPDGTGIPSNLLPADPQQLSAPGRVLRRAATVALAWTRPDTVVLGVLGTAGDDRIDWLRAGEALSAGWLTATGSDVSVLPLSIVIEVASARSMIRNMTGRHPQLVLRFAAGAPIPGASRSPRLPAAGIIEQA